MIISERFVKVPYQEYKVTLQHAAIRKLTVIEWSLLRIVSQFGGQNSYKDYSLNRFYEEILGMDNCEMLLKPCVNELLSLEMITIEGYSDTTIVARIKLGKIVITERGTQSLKDGYLLGIVQEADETAYLEEVTDKIIDSIQDYSDQDINHTAKAIGKKKKRVTPFPADRFVHEINSGNLFKEKYYDGRRWVQSAICAEEKEKDLTTLLLLEQTRDNRLKCNFPLDDDVFELVKKIVASPFTLTTPVDEWNPQEPLPNSASFGAKILRPILSSLEYCEHVFISRGLYDLILEENKRAFDGKTVFIIGSDEFSIDEFQGVISLPSLLEAENICYLDDKKDSYSLFVKRAELDGRQLDIYFTERMDMPNNATQLLFTSTAVLAQKYPEVIAVFSLPVFNIRQEKIDELYMECLSRCCSFMDAVQYAARVSSVSKRLRSVERKPDIAEKYFQKHMLYADSEALLADLQYAYQYYYNMFDSKYFLNLLLNAALHYSGENRIEAIEAIFNLAEKFCSNKYDKKSYCSLISKYIEPTITSRDYDALYVKVSNPVDLPKTSLFASYADFLKFSEAYSGVSSMLMGFEWKKSYSNDELLLILIECSNIIQVCEYVDYMLELSSRQSFRDCAFFQNNQMWENAQNLREILSQFILPEGIPAPIYIIDTCAFLHTPYILDYFREDEIIRVPQMVLQELDKHKDNWKNPDLHFAAVKACKSIEEHNTKAKLGGMLTFDLESRDYPELLPVGITYANNDRLSPDNLILSCAFRYKAFRPTILTDDTNFRNVSRSQGVEVKAWKEFIEERGGKAERDSQSIKKKADTLPIQHTNQVEKKPLVKSSAQAPDTGNKQSTSPNKQLREEWLKRPVEDLTIDDIGVSPKVVKGLSAIGITTIKKLVETTDATIRQKIKALSIRTGAIEAKKKFEKYIENIQLVETTIDSKEDQSSSSVTEMTKDVPESPISYTAVVSVSAVTEAVSEIETPEASEKKSEDKSLGSDIIEPHVQAVPENIPLTQMGLSIRSFNSLYRAGYKVSGDIIHLSDDQLLKVTNLNMKGVAEIRNWIKSNMKSDQNDLTKPSGGEAHKNPSDNQGEINE